MSEIKNLIILAIGVYCLILAGLSIATCEEAGFSKFLRNTVVGVLVAIGVLMVHIAYHN